jgi:hypothetical protein
VAYCERPASPNESRPFVRRSKQLHWASLLYSLLQFSSFGLTASLGGRAAPLELELPSLIRPSNSASVAEA